ncbi:hypothetical protein BGW42_003289 [Actinomortierella wolfii]|nr:hypothetical protein BGW42_003289 [Actinomortierella wolfii]
MAPLLERLLTGKEPSPFILIKDNLEQSGLVLGLELLSHSPKEVVAVDCYSNHSGWNPAKAPKSGKIISTVIQSTLTSLRKTTKVIVDLVAALPDTFNMLRSITSVLTDTSRIIAIYHEDMPDADTFHPDASKPYATHSLAHIAHTQILIRNAERIREEQEDLRNGVVRRREFSYLTPSSNAWDSAVCEVEHRRKSGKVARESSAYQLSSPDGPLKVVNVWEVAGEMPDIEKLDLEESQTVDPTANLSFNLNLTEEQRKAKNETVLPYVKTQETSGAIYYEPDAGDDFDDDDPDDDLTI